MIAEGVTGNHFHELPAGLQFFFGLRYKSRARLACKKYLPSVQRRASVAETMAVPALPEKPLMNLMRSSLSAMYSL